MEKTLISFEGVISKNDRTKFSTEEYEKLIDDILDAVDNHKCSFGGGIGLHTEDEYEEILNNK